VVFAQPDQCLEVAGGVIQRLQAAEPVAVGAQVVGEFVAVAGVRFGAGGAPAGPGGVERGRMDGHDRVAGGQEPVDDQAAGSFDSDGEVGRVAVAGQPGDGLGQPVLGVRWRPSVDHGAGGVDDGDVMGGACPVPADEHRTCLLMVEWLLDGPSPGAGALLRPSRGDCLMPVGGSGAAGGGRTQTGHLVARQRGRPPDTYREHDPALTGRTRILHQ